MQKTLQASRAALIGAGILHPNIGKNSNHKALLPYLASGASTVQLLGPRSSTIVKDSAQKWAGLVEEVRTSNPNTIILSSESFSQNRGGDALKNMGSHLQPLAHEIVIAAYLREPASLALSRAQQQLKSKPNFTLRPNDYYRSMLEPYKTSGLGSMTVRIFDRKTLEGGDIVKDFFAQHVPHFAPERLSRLKDDNTTFSAEAMALLQEVHRQERSLPWRKASLSIETADRELDGFTRPRMHDHVRQAIQARCTDLGWLKDEFGLEFPKIAAGAMLHSDADRLCDALDRVEDMCVIDADRKAALWNAVFKNQRPINRLRRILKID